MKDLCKMNLQKTYACIACRTCSMDLFPKKSISIMAKDWHLSLLGTKEYCLKNQNVIALVTLPTMGLLEQPQIFGGAQCTPLLVMHVPLVLS